MEESGMKREEKIQEILFQGKQNDLSPSVEWLAKGLSDSWVEYSFKESDFESLYTRARSDSSKIFSFSNFAKNKTRFSAFISRDFSFRSYIRILFYS